MHWIMVIADLLQSYCSPLQLERLLVGDSCRLRGAEGAPLPTY